MMPEPFRVPPRMDPTAYKTYRIQAPKATHYRKATCREVDCPNFASGWLTTVDVSTELGARQANYIRLHSGRSFTYVEVGTLVSFTFPAGQACFQEHTRPLDRPEIYTVTPGDYRAATGETRRHRNADDWVDDFAEHQNRLHTEHEKG
jgi:hypothetical protein